MNKLFGFAVPCLITMLMPGLTHAQEEDEGDTEAPAAPVELAIPVDQPPSSPPAPVHVEPPPPSDLDATQIYERGLASVVKVHSQGGRGLGVLVESEGGELHILTAEHYAANTNWIEVRTLAGKKQDAEIMWWERAITSLAVAEPLQDTGPMPLCESGPDVGDTVWTFTPPSEGGLGKLALHEARVAAVGKYQYELDIQGSWGRLGGPVVSGDGCLTGIVTNPKHGTVIVQRPKVLRSVLAESSGMPAGSSPEMGMGLAVTFLSVYQDLDQPTELGLALDTDFLSGRYFLVPISVWGSMSPQYATPVPGITGHARVQVMAGVGADLELSPPSRSSKSLVLQFYGAVGVAGLFSKNVSNTLQLSDPACDPTQEPCTVVDSTLEIQERAPFMFGGGMRWQFNNLRFGLAVSTSAIRPQEDFSVMFNAGWAVRQARRSPAGR